MNVIFIDPLVQYPTKRYGNGRRADLGIRWSIAYLIGVLKQVHPDVQAHYFPYRLYEFLGKPVDLVSILTSQDVVCIGACTAEVPSALRIAQAAKKLGKTTILGGIFPTSNPRFIARSGFVDYIVMGEGEETFVELISCLKADGNVKSIPGLVVTKDSQFYLNTRRQSVHDIDDYKPSLAEFPLREYSALNLGSLYTSRGCRHHCPFCTAAKHWGGLSRSHTTGFILKLLEELAEHNFSRIHFLDEAIADNRDRALAIFRAIKERRLPFRIKVKSRLSDIDYVLLEAMCEAGVYMIQCGVETTAYEKVPFAHNKNADIVTLDVIPLMLSYGLELNLIYQIGIPGLNSYDLARDKDFIIDTGMSRSVLTYLCFYTPHPTESLVSEAQGFSSYRLTSNLDYYTHKYIVSVPESLGNPHESLYLMHSTYHEIVRALGAKNNDVNPSFDLSYIYQSNPELKDVSVVKVISSGELED